MAKTAVVCLQCGHRSLQWVGRCPSCGAWDSFTDEPQSSSHAPAPVSIAEIDTLSRPRIPSGLGEFDRVLGGGIVSGSTVLVAGEPGIGKSTLLLQAAAGYELSGHDVLIVCGEESIEQVALRANRINGPTKTRLSSAVDLPSVIAHCTSAKVAVVDSIQTIRDPGASGEPGSPNQVRACAAALAAAARESGTAVILIGHVTKDGSVAGPRVLEHLVDAVITFDGERAQALRTVRAIKNRFGPTAEIGVFEMAELGLTEIKDASKLFLEGRSQSTVGSTVGCVLEGRRALAVEVQALCCPTSFRDARRVARGLEFSKLAVVLAILERKTDVSVAGRDVYVSIAGGLQLNDPGIDLPLALSIAGAVAEKPIPSDAAFVGELALDGSIRAVPGINSRVNELTRLGFKHLLVPFDTDIDSRIQLTTVRDLKAAISLVL